MFNARRSASACHRDSARDFPGGAPVARRVLQGDSFASSSVSELQNRTWDYPMSNFVGAFGYERGRYGYGIGTCSLGGQYIASLFHARPVGVGVESGFGHHRP